MKKKILFTRPRDKPETMYLHYFCKELIKEIKSVGEFIVLDLEDKEVTRNGFERTIKKGNPRLIILNGHGSKELILGYKDDIILDENNINLLQSTIIYAVSCDTLTGLGELAIHKGKAEAYIGYSSRFMLIIDPTKSAVIQKDKNIEPFRQVYIRMVTCLISGLNIRSSIEDTKEFIRSLIREYGVYGIRDKFGDAPLIRMALFWNMFFLNAYGKLEAVI